MKNGFVLIFEVKIINQNLPANTLTIAKIIGYEKNYLIANAL
jgi:hypothetical protein